MAIFRIYVEKKPAYAEESARLLGDLRTLLGLEGLSGLRLLNRYDVEGIDQALFDACRSTVFSEPQLDDCCEELPRGDYVFGVEPLPGQFDQRADSCAQCIQIVSQGERPLVRTAKIYVLEGDLTPAQVEAVKHYVINPVECREADLAPAVSLALEAEHPDSVPTLTGFLDLDRKALGEFIRDYGLAMDLDDIAFCQDYFRREEKRDPTLTEIRMIDTYWSDHCRHTTFGTVLSKVTCEEEAVERAFQRYLAMRHAVYGEKEKPVCLMDLATMGGKYLKKTGVLRDLDESEEINACSVKIKVDVDGEDEDWLLMFKNETHNHPTEIEPFGGAATCIGGAIRDPLSGRSYVYQAMRVTGAADPLAPVKDTIPGKLPQRKLTTTAAAGYSSYGNQIGLATGMVDELYHPGYAAKRMEIGAVLGAAPAENVRRERPAPGDVVVLLGGRTGRDGCGGATGSSKSHNKESLSTCGAEVQKGNAPEERKLQRLFRDPAATALIKRCNDFGAGGVSVAIGELADGLAIDLDAVPKKYDGLDGTELAISESQERMAVVLDPDDADAFIAMARRENLEATKVAVVTAQPRLTMEWKGKRIVDLSREFLSSNGAKKYAEAVVEAGEVAPRSLSGSLRQRLEETVTDLNVCSKKGLSERFDSTIGAATVVMPFGGKHQLTPVQAMAAKLPVLHGETTTCFGMAWGYNPVIASQSPYRGSYLAVVESLSKLIAAGFPREHAYMTFQEYFERLGADPRRWGKPLGALLGALEAQDDLGVAAIGGKDSMSGSFENLDVPPTLVSFAVSWGSARYVTTPEFRRPGSTLCWLAPETRDGLIPQKESLLGCFEKVEALIREGCVLSASTPGYGGMAEQLFKSCLGNRLGVELEPAFPLDRLFGYAYGGFILELAPGVPLPEGGELLGRVTGEYAFAAGGERVELEPLQALYEGKLEPVFPYHTTVQKAPVETFTSPARKPAAPRVGAARPQALIPVFPGTNCEYDTARALSRAGIRPRILVVRNLTARDVAESAAAMAEAIGESQMVVIPGGFSGGDEPDGSGKFITAFFRNPRVKESVRELLQHRDGLMCGICNGFQALVKLGLVPYGDIVDAEEDSPTLTYNVIGRHQSMLVRTRVASNMSPWLSRTQPGEVHTVAISHGEGRFVAPEETIRRLAQNGQIATQYVDLAGEPTMDVRYNPNGSLFAVEGITSPDGRVLGKMGHTERSGPFLYKNVEGEKYQPLFEGAADYYKL